MKLVPLFPLSLVVFPFEELNLHIFEPRYKQLISDCIEGELEIGIPFYEAGHKMKFGSLVKVLEVSKRYEDGRMDIKTVGVKPFELQRYRVTYPEKLYPGGYVTELYWDKDGSPRHREEIRRLLAELYEFMNIQEAPKALNKSFLTFEIAHKVAFNKDQEYAFLQIIGEMDRQEYMIAHLSKMIPVIREAEEMRRKIQLNGHFKHIQPPDIV